MTTKLPTIAQRGARSADVSMNSPEIKAHLAKSDIQAYVSPFRLPSDDEVFVFRELEKKKRDELKQVSQTLKVWEKKTETLRRPLNLFRNVELENKEIARLTHQRGYSTHEKSTIIEAQRIMHERRRNREMNGGKETKEGILEMLEQKKEMFLVEMTAGIIEKEKESLVVKATEKEQALKKSDDMLEKDWREFEEYKQKNKQETDQAIQEYNQQAELRKKTEQDYKIKNNELTNMKADKIKNEEIAQKYTDVRNFLEKITPKDFLDQRKAELEAKIEEIKAKYMDREHMLHEGSHTSLPESTNRGAKDKDKKSQLKRNTKQDAERSFAEKLEHEDLDEIEEFKWTQEMYFKDPQQLIDVYTRLEEENVSLIQSMQDTESALENLRNTLKQKRDEFDRRSGGLREHKQHLEKSKAEKLEQIKALKLKFNEPTLSADYDEAMEPFREKIVKVVADGMKDESRGVVDVEAMSTLELLGPIEIHLERQLRKLREQKPSRVMELKREFEDIRKKEKRMLQLKAEQELAQLRSMKANERGKEKAKRKGRVDMTKSVPLEKNETAPQAVEIDEDEVDMKYFRPYLTKF